jgi:pyruvate/2-oxoglutarate dehydrogenase complex dihydrolipoamide acyltransferase (E2) component
MTLPVPLVFERDNVNDESVVLVRWLAKHGEKVEANALVAEIETSKANIEVPAPQAGYLVWSFPEGTDVPVSTPIGYISAVPPTSGFQLEVSSAENPASATSRQIKEEQLVSSARPSRLSGRPPAEASMEQEFRTSTPYRQRFSPVAARMMEAHELNAAIFAGKSVVRKQDILDYLNPPAVVMEEAVPARRNIGATKITQPYREIALSKMKRSEGRSLAAGVGNAVQSAVSVTCFTQGIRRDLDARAKNVNTSAIIVYEVSRLLRKYPNLNATYRADKMLQYEQVNLGYAMDDGRGLKVAVLQSCDTLSLQQISAVLRELTMAYIEDKLTPVQISNATFTVSDLSGLGVSSFYPLISENQGSILGVGGEQFPPGSTYGFYTLTLTFDHQLSDGRTAALFLNDLKSRLQGYEETSKENFCSQCGRTAGQLAERASSLLLSASPEGYICTLCAAGY